MDFERLDQLAQKYLLRRKSHIEREIGAAYFHGERTAKGVLLLREQVTSDASHDDELRVAAMFHDIGKGIEPHAHTGAVLARDLLASELTPQELETVCALIAAHPHRRPEADEHSLWEKLLQDADLLDHYGIQGIWLGFSYLAYTDQKDMLQCLRFYLEEWPAQVEKHRKLLNFPQARAIFEEKVAFERSIVERTKIEGAGGYLKRGADQ